MNVSIKKEWKRFMNDWRRFISGDRVALKKLEEGRYIEGSKELLTNEVGVVQRDIKNIPNGLNTWKKILRIKEEK